MAKGAGVGVGIRVRVRLFVVKLRGLLFGGRGDDPEFDAEMQEHLRLLAQRYVRQGMTSDEAAQAARRQFGNVTLLQEERGSMRTIPTVDALWRDARHAARLLRKQPTFTAAVVLTLALGIGANTAIFSLCSAMLLKPLPYADPDRLVMLWEQLPGSGELMAAAPANFLDVRQQTQSFAHVAAIDPFPSFVLTGSGDPVRLAGAKVSWDFFALLGTPMAIGRSFLPEEDQPGRDRVAILSHGTWVDRFGARPDILRTPVTFNDTSYTVVGVLPREFEFVGTTKDYQRRNRFDLWVPIALPAKPSRGSHPLRIFARLKPDITLEQAQADLDVVAARLARDFPEENKDRGIRAVTLRQQVTADFRPVLFTLLGAVGFLLSIACANVANLLLTRGAARQKETAVRLALGASRARLAQQLLVESALLGLIGGALGLGLAAVVMRLAIAYLPPDLARAGVAIDWRVVIFTGVVSLGTGLLFGLAPLFHARRVSAHDALAQGTRVAGGLQMRLRNALVIAQVAIALVLLIGAGLMARSLWTLLHVAPGFRSDQVLTARVTMPRQRYPDAAAVGAFHRDLLERLRNSPGVQAAGAASYIPLSGDDNGWAFFIEGRPPKPVGVYDFAKYRPVSDGYFETMGMPLIQGRTIRSADDHTTPWVVVINEAMARRFWGSQNPVGQRLRFGARIPRTVIGVVGDVRHDGLDDKAKPEMYVPMAQAPNVETAPTILVRTAIDAAAMTSTVRAAVAATDASVPLDRISTMTQLVSASVGQPRFRTFLLAALSLLALAMASVGIYGVTSYTVAQRTREFGIYLAVGATAADVLRLVLGRAALLIAAGLGIGLLTSLALTRFIANLLYGIPALDSTTFALVSLLLLIVALLASYVPARRATRIDPMVALRYE